jgi:hypothetical protein
MDHTLYREFFAQPTHPYHRRYEALRAVFLDGRSQKEVAEHFGYRYSTLRQMVYEFRRLGHDSDAVSPFFEIPRVDARPRRASPRGRTSPRPPRSRRPTWRIVGNWPCRSRRRYA